jgi:hypothetical protein
LRETGKNKKKALVITDEVHRHNEAQPRKGTARKSPVLRQDFE